MFPRIILITFLFSLFSCDAGESNDNSESSLPISDTRTISESLIDKINSSSDSVLIDTNQKNNHFQYDYTNEKIDLNITSKISGEWISKIGGLSFFKVKHNISDRVVFSDKTEILITGWGEIKFNRSSKWYNSVSLNYKYEYFIDDKGYLHVLEFDYRNDDLSFKSKPEVKRETIKVEWISDSDIDLISNGIKFRYSRL